MSDELVSANNALLTVDVEDWLQLSAEVVGGTSAACIDSLQRQLDRLLQLLNDSDCRATFFCLGKSLEASPHLVARLVQQGHEVASHGWNHQRIFRIGLDAFREDLLRSLKWLADVTQQPVKGYRAPAFSVAADQLQGFYDICFEAGLAYDSSVFPFAGTRYGLPRAPADPHVVRREGSRQLIELPLATIQLFGRRWPLAGGGWWRILPGAVVRAGLKRIANGGYPPMTYFHPHEFDSRPLDVSAAVGASLRAALWNCRQNLGRRHMFARLEKALADVRFTTIEDYLAGMASFGGKELSPAALKSAA